MPRGIVATTGATGQILEEPNHPIALNETESVEPVETETPNVQPLEQPTLEVAPEEKQPEETYAEWRWRNENKKIRMAPLMEVAKDLGVEPAALLNMSQLGRDVQYHQGRVRQREAEIADMERDLKARASLIEQAFRGMAETRDGYQGARPSHPGYRRPAPYMSQEPTAPPQAPGQPPDPTYIINTIASLPQMLDGLRNEFRTEIRNYTDQMARDRISRDIVDDEAKYLAEAGSFLEEMKTEGWNLPENLDAEGLIEQANRLGPGLNPNVPFREAIETAFASLTWRHSFKVGQATTVADLSSDRSKPVRVPPTRGGAIPSAATEGGTGGRMKAALEIGRNISMSDALNQR